MNRVLSLVLLALSSCGIAAAQTPPAGTPHSVTLTWTAPSPVGGSGTIAGYNVYKSLSGAAFVKVNTTIIPLLTFTDSSVLGSQSLSYCATTVDSIGSESKCSVAAAAHHPARRESADAQDNEHRHQQRQRPRPPASRLDGLKRRGHLGQHLRRTGAIAETGKPNHCERNLFVCRSDSGSKRQRLHLRRQRLRHPGVHGNLMAEHESHHGETPEQQIIARLDFIEAQLDDVLRLLGPKAARIQLQIKSKANLGGNEMVPLTPTDDAYDIAAIGELAADGVTPVPLPTVAFLFAVSDPSLGIFTENADGKSGTFVAAKLTADAAGFVTITDPVVGVTKEIAFYVHRAPAPATATAARGRDHPDFGECCRTLRLLTGGSSMQDTWLNHNTDKVLLLFLVVLFWFTTLGMAYLIFRFLFRQHDRRGLCLPRVASVRYLALS